MLSTLILSSLIATQVTTASLTDIPATAPTLGQKTAKVEMVEFADFQCPFCSQFALNTFPQIKKDYIDTGKVYFVHRDFPLDFHFNAEAAAEAGQCAQAQGVFWNMSTMLYKKQSQWEDSKKPAMFFRQYARKAGADMKTFNACISKGTSKDAIATDIAAAGYYKIAGTPGFLINGTMVSGAQPYEEFKKVLDEALNK